MPIEIEPKADNDKLNNSKESNNQTSKPDNKPENKPITPKKVKDLERKLEKSQEDLRLTKDFKKEMLVENQPKPERIEKPAESTEKKTHKITVTVKLSADNTNTLVADNAPKKPKTKVGKMLKTIKDVKNGELEPGEFKIFGRDADKMFASIGKD
jgi:chromosome condensin MukBEF ATPase and DNA-binding subunit MukB